MEIIRHYGLFILISIGFMIPFTGFVIGASTIVNTTVTAFLLNWTSQAAERNMFDSLTEKPKKGFLGKFLASFKDQTK